MCFVSQLFIHTLPCDGSLCLRSFRERRHAHILCVVAQQIVRCLLKMLVKNFALLGQSHMRELHKQEAYITCFVKSIYDEAQFMNVFLFLFIYFLFRSDSGLGMLAWLEHQVMC